MAGQIPVINGAIRLEGDTSRLPKMVEDARRIGQSIEQEFASAFSEVGAMASRALASFNGGKVSLDVDTSTLRQAAADAELALRQLQQMRDAAVSLRAATGDTSEQTRAFVLALDQQVQAAIKARNEAQTQVTTYERLQAEIDKTVSANDRLAQSYRRTFEEQARAANTASNAQRFFTPRAADPFNSASRNGATTSALSTLFAEQEAAEQATMQAAAAAARAAAEMNALRLAEEGAARGADLLAAAHRGTALEIDRVEKSARESARTFEQAFAEQERAATEAAAAAARYAADVEAVRRAIDPTRVAQQQLDVELARAEMVFARGAISAEEYGLAVNAAADRFQEYVTGAREGTTANHMMVNSSRAMRTAMLQAGQQAQDVAISLYSGQQASVVFAQQLPQLAFALTGLEGSANKTHDRIGRFATMLSGPWGLAIGLAAGAAFELAAALISSGDEAEKTGRATDRLTDKLDLTKNSYETLRSVVEEYNKAQSKTESLTYGAIIAAEKEAQALLKVARARLANTELNSLAAGQSLDAGAGAITGAGLLYSRLQEQIDQLEKDLRDAGVAGGAERTRRATDRRYDIQVGYDEKIVQLEEKRRRNLIDQVGYERERLKLINDQKAALDAFDASQRSGRGGGGGGGAAARDARVGDMVALVQQLFPGARITSTTGGKHTKGSDHYAGRAIDFVPAGGMAAYSTAEVERILEEAGVDIRRNASGTKQIFGPGRSAGKPGDHNDHFHFAWKGSVDPERASEAASRASERQAEATARLAEFARDARASIAAIGSSFAETPPAIQESQRELERLNDLAADIMLRKPEGWEAMLAAIEELRPKAEDLANGPFKDMLEATEEQAKIEQLILAGREGEAEVLKRQLALEKAMGPLGAEQKAVLAEIVAQERVRARLIEEQAAQRQIELDYLDATKNNLRQTVYGLLRGQGIGSIGNLIKAQFDAVIQQMTDSIMEDVFGDTFRDARDKAMGFDKVQEASKRTAKVSNVAADALAGLARAARGATAALDGTAANDNALEQQFDEAFNVISVEAPKSIGKTVRSELKGLGKSIFGADAFASISNAVKTGFQGAAYGQAASGIGKSLGIKQSKTGSQIGGAIGMAVGGPVGAMIGGFLGGTIGGMFKSTPKGRVTVTDGSIGYRGAGRYRDQLLDAGSGIQGGIESIADQLGGSIGSYSVSLKRKGKKYYVNGQKFRDEQDAAEAAILAAIQNGAVKGIKAGAQRLLAAGTDLDRQLSKAVKFQNVFDELDNLKDPVGFAVRSLNREFEGLIRIFNEAGATAEEMAQLEELYGIKRAAAVEEANDRIAASLKSLYDELTVGNEALPLRMRQAMAMERYTGLEARVQAGDTSAYDDFAEATQTLMAVSRELFGSQQGYFDLLNRATQVTGTAINSQSALASSASSIASPFAAAATSQAAANKQVVDALAALGINVVDGLGFKLDAVNDNLGALILQGIAAARMAETGGLASTGTW